MDTLKRRKSIEEILILQEYPIKGSDLAEKFNVSRQVIVQDIAILRAKGLNIMATPQGYVLPKFKNENLIKVIASNHKSNIQDIKDELEIIVDLGAKIIDVIIEHPVYGEIRGMMNICSRKEVNDFIEKLKNKDIKGICSLTNGLHFHTIEVKNEELYEELIKNLDKKGYLLKYT